MMVSCVSEIKLSLVFAHLFSSPVSVEVMDAPICMKTACLICFFVVVRMPSPHPALCFYSLVFPDSLDEIYDISNTLHACPPVVTSGSED